MSAFSVDTGRQTTPPIVDGVVHNKLVQFTPHGDQTLAQLVDVLVVNSKCMPVLYIFPLSALQKLLKSVKICQMYTATFYDVCFDFSR